MVIGLGTAGAIGDGLVAGDLVVSSGALRDEDTSHHYARQTGSPCPSPA
jgi:uridine phosphorylase